MKRVFAIFSVIVICLSLWVGAFEPVSDVAPAVADVESVSVDAVPSSSLPVNDDELILNSVSLMSVAPIEAKDATGLKKILIQLFGSYDPVVYDYEYRNNNATYYSHSIDIQPDYVWLCSFGIFCLIVYCIFRLGGALIK